MKYHLWIDESGDFKNNNSEISLVGGILYQDTDEVNEEIIVELWEEAQKIIDIGSHANEVNGAKLFEFSKKFFPKLLEKNIHLVIFENQEKIMILNEDITYIHIISEGFVQLLQYLSLSEDYIELNFNIARRMGNDGTVEILEDEYKERLKERIELAFARRSLNKNQLKWNIEILSARKEKMLYISDLICHIRYHLNKQTKSKFTLEQASVLNKYFDPNFYFTAIDNYTIRSIQNNLNNGHYSDALYNLIMILSNQIQMDNSLEDQHLDKLKDLLKKTFIRISHLEDYIQDSIFMHLINQLKVYNSIHRLNVNLEKLINFIDKDLLTLLKEINFEDPVLTYHLNLLILTDATHRGNLKLAEEKINEIQSLLSVLAKRWDNINLIIDFLIRKTVHQTNTFNYQKVIDTSEQLEDFIRDYVDLFSGPISSFIGNEEEMTSDFLGKIIGTRLQARIYLSGIDQSQLDKAREDSDSAIKQFEDVSDINRQYQYRTQLETFAENFEEAWFWFTKSLELEATTQPNQVLSTILSKEQIDIYSLMHYARMFGRFNRKEATNLFDEWVKFDLSKKLKSEKHINFPIEIIHKNIALYHSSQDNLKASIDHFEEAIKLATADKNQVTRNVIGLAILSQATSIMIQKNPKDERTLNIRNLLLQFEKLLERNLPDNMIKILETNYQLLKENENNLDEFSKVALNFSKIINY